MCSRSVTRLFGALAGLLAFGADLLPVPPIRAQEAQPSVQDQNEIPGGPRRRMMKPASPEDFGVVPTGPEGMGIVKKPPADAGATQCPCPLPEPYTKCENSQLWQYRYVGPCCRYDEHRVATSEPCRAKLEDDRCYPTCREKCISTRTNKTWEQCVTDCLVSTRC